MHQSVVKCCDIWNGIKTDTIIFLTNHVYHNRKNEKCPNTYVFIPGACFCSTFGEKRIPTNNYKGIYEKLVDVLGDVRVNVMIYDGRQKQTRTNNHVNILFGKKSSQYIGEKHE